MYQIYVYIPINHVEEVKTAMFQAGAGNIGNYSFSSWQTLGEGQFLPLENSHPYLGNKFQLQKIPEYKVEIVCEDAYIHDVIKALREAHPYEQPAFQVIYLKNF